MKPVYKIVTILLAVAAVLAVSAPRAHAQGPNLNWYRLYNGGVGDHFYTCDWVENLVAQAIGYQAEGIEARVWSASGNGRVPLYRLYHLQLGDHFYTTSAVERGIAILKYGYHSEGISCYLYPNHVLGTYPIYRLYNGGLGDHFYTMRASEVSYASVLGYTWEGVAGYAYPGTNGVN
jgi:hypothetical protein